MFRMAGFSRTTLYSSSLPLSSSSSQRALSVCSANLGWRREHKPQSRNRFRPNKHKNPEWAGLRAAKVLKVRDVNQGLPIVRQSLYHGGPWAWVLCGYRERLSGGGACSGSRAKIPGNQLGWLCLSAAPGSRRVPNPRGHRDNDFDARWAILCYIFYYPCHRAHVDKG